MISNRSIAALFSLAFVIAAVAGSECAAQDSKASSAVDSFPLFVRLDRAALAKLTHRDVDRCVPVDRVVLGTHSVGTCRILGTVDSTPVPDSKEASFDLYFRGKITTQSVGTNGPVIVYSRTFTDITCVRRIAFDPRLGFVAIGGSIVSGNTCLVYDGFAAKRRIGHRLVCRIAERRAGQMHEQARQIANRTTQAELQESFDREVAEGIVAANQRLDLARYVRQFLGDDAALQLQAASTLECIQIGIGPADGKFAPATILPARLEKSAPIEIWVRDSILNEAVLASMKLAAAQSSMSAQLRALILTALSIPGHAADSSLRIAVADGWLVLGLPDDRPLAGAKDSAAGSSLGDR